jgi:hypothetical protein
MPAPSVPVTYPHCIFVYQRGRFQPNTELHVQHLGAYRSARAKEFGELSARYNCAA